MRDNLRESLTTLMTIPGLSGHEDRVRRHIAERLQLLGIDSKVDRLGNLEGAQPYLRRIIRTYPRSFFASYARRLVNQYEAYADRD